MPDKVNSMVAIEPGMLLRVDDADTGTVWRMLVWGINEHDISGYTYEQWCDYRPCALVIPAAVLRAAVSEIRAILDVNGKVIMPFSVFREPPDWSAVKRKFKGVEPIWKRSGTSTCR